MKNDWSSGEIAERVRAHNALPLVTGGEPAPAPAEPVELLKPRCGIPGLRLLVERPPTSLSSALAIDLGFKNYADLPAATAARFKAGDIVRWDADGVKKIAAATPAQLFTYRATIRKIVDGDTLDIVIALAPGFTRDLRLRLRGLDCPELATAAGRAAKAYVEKLLAPGDEVILCTTKPDKYDRYLADVFVSAGTSPNSDFQSSPSDPTDPLFLNNALLSARHATRYDGGAKE